MPRTATFCSSVSILEVVKNPGRKIAKTANNAAKTANTIPCCPNRPIPIPTALVVRFAKDVRSL
jgi:hypothetical protein